MDNHAEREALLERLVSLERRVAIHSRLAALALVGCAILITTAQVAGPPQEMRARSFVVVDERGERRAAFGFTQGETGLVAVDGAGRPRLIISVSDSMTQLSMRDPVGRPRMILAATGTYTQLDQKDVSGRTRFSIGTADDQNGSAIRLFDAQGTLRGTLAFFASAGPGLTLLDETGRPTFSTVR